MGLFFSDEDAAYLKSCYTAKEAAMDMGLEFNRANPNELLCPDRGHSDVHFGSCKVRKDGSIYCYACHKSFSAVDIFMEAGGISFYESLCHIAEITGQADKYEEKGSAPKKKKDVMRRLRPDEKVLLGFARENKGHCYTQFQTWKPDNDDKIRYDRTEDGYLIYEKDTMSWNWMITEMPYQYKNMVLNKVYEKLYEIRGKADEIRNLLHNHPKDGSYVIYQYMMENYKEEYEKVYNIGIEFGILEVEKVKQQEIIPFVSRTA